MFDGKKQVAVQSERTSRSKKISPRGGLVANFPELGVQPWATRVQASKLSDDASLVVIQGRRRRKIGCLKLYVISRTATPALPVYRARMHDVARSLLRWSSALHKFPHSHVSGVHAHPLPELEERIDSASYCRLESCPRLPQMLMCLSRAYAAYGREATRDYGNDDTCCIKEQRPLELQKRSSLVRCPFPSIYV